MQRSAEYLNAAVEKYKNTVYGTAFSQLQNRAEAEDVFQEVFLTYYTKELCFEDEAARKSWLIRATLNLCKKRTSSLWRRRTVPLDDAMGFSDTAAMPSDEIGIWQAVNKLKPAYRTVVYLFYFEQQSLKDIAAALGVSAGTVQVRLVRARGKLKTMLEGEYFYE